MGKQIYLSDKQIDFIKRVLDPYNFHFESGAEEEVEEAFAIRDQIISKVSK
jgi:hypothetical protein